MEISVYTFVCVLFLSVFLLTVSPSTADACVMLIAYRQASPVTPNDHLSRLLNYWRSCCCISTHLEAHAPGPSRYVRCQVVFLGLFTRHFTSRKCSISFYNFTRLLRLLSRGFLSFVLNTDCVKPRWCHLANRTYSYVLQQQINKLLLKCLSLLVMQQ